MCIRDRSISGTRPCPRELWFSPFTLIFGGSFVPTFSPSSLPCNNPVSYTHLCIDMQMLESVSFYLTKLSCLLTDFAFSSNFLMTQDSLLHKTGRIAMFYKNYLDVFSTYWPTVLRIVPHMIVKVVSFVKFVYSDLFLI